MAISPETLRITEFGSAIVTVARISFLLVGIASTAVIIASIVVPYSTSFFSTSLPQIQTLASSWLSPSHLFITVHFIIIVIWKLQDNNNNNNNENPINQSVDQKQQQQEDAEIEYEIKPPEIPCTVQPVTLIPDPSDPVPDLPDPIPTADDNTMDATWKSIVEADSAASPASARPKMRKSETWERCNRECSPAAEGRFRKSKTFRRASVGRDELFGRAEAFIRTHYEQRRIQRQESEQRYAEMVNAAC